MAGHVGGRADFFAGSARRRGVLRRNAAFVLGSARRHPALFAIVWVGMVGLVLAAVLLLPGTYEVECTLMYSPSKVLRVRQDGLNSLPTLATAELVRGHESLVRIVRSSGLVDEWSARRPPALRAKDALFERLRGKPTEEQLVEGIADALEHKLGVWAERDGTVYLRVRWNDPEVAYRLAVAAQEAFLAERWSAEVGHVEKLVAILTDHEKALSAKVQDELRQLEREAARRAAALAALAATPLSQSALPELRELRELKVRREAVRARIEREELDRYRRSSAFKGELQQKSGIYTEGHPIMVGLRQRIDAAERQGSEEVRLREEELALTQTIEDLEVGVKPADRGVQDRPYLSRGAEQSLAAGRPRAEGALLDQAEAARARIERLQIELDVAKAAFPHRYVVVEPPVRPRGPIAPRPAVALLSAALYGFCLAFFATTLAEVRHGMLNEAWQLEAALGRGVPIVEVKLT